MKNEYLVLAVLILTGCGGDWKSSDNRKGLLAEPSGYFKASPEIIPKDVCVEDTVNKIDSDLKTKDQVVRTKYVESGERSIFMKMTTEIKDVSAEKVTSVIHISDVQGFDIGDVTLEETCEVKGDVNCEQTGNEGAPKPSFEFEDCYINALKDERNIAVHGTYTLKNAKEISARHTTQHSSGHIFCTVNNEKKSVGNGVITVDRYSSPNILALPGTANDCVGPVFFVSKTVTLENGKKIEYVRNEIVEVPVKKDSKDNKEEEKDEKTSP